MKILLLGLKEQFNNANGRGPSRYIYELATRLGFDKCMVGVPGAFGSGRSQTGNNVFFALNNAVSVWTRKWDGYDLIHDLFFNGVLRGGIGTPVLSTLYDFRDYDHAAYEKYGMPKGNPISNGVAEYVFRKTIQSEYLVAISTQTKNEAISAGHRARSIYVTPLGIDERFSASVRRKDNVEFKVGYVGNLSKNKNVQMAIRAIGIIKGQNLSFEIWGEKSIEYPYLFELAGSDKRINFMGFAPERGLVDTYDRFDAFVFPSLYEGFGLPILEAQARGLPVIIYKGSKIAPEVRRYCLEAKDEEHMAQMIEGLMEKGYNERDRKRATAYARSFTWEKCAMDTEAVYKKILHS